MENKSDKTKVVSRRKTVGTRRETKKHQPTVEFTSSGCDLLDLALGGGFPWGKIVNIVGDTSSGKTALAIECLHRTIKDQDVMWHYNDAESGFSFNTQAMYGFEALPKDKKDRSQIIEQLIADVKKKIFFATEQKKRLIYTIDSLDGLSCQAELNRAQKRFNKFEKQKEAVAQTDEERKKEKGSYNMEKQRMINEFFRTEENRIEDTKTLLIIISQTRENIGVVFGQKWRVSCEGAMKFYAAHRIVLKEIKKIKKKVDGKEYPIGVRIHAYVFKNKIAAPFKECNFEILFDYGVDNVSSNLNYIFDLLTEKGEDKKKIDVEWDEVKFTTKESLISHIEAKNQEDDILELTKFKWQRIEDQLAPKRKRK